MPIDRSGLARTLVAAIKARYPQAPVTEPDVDEAISSGIANVLRRGKFPHEVYSPNTFNTVSGNYSYPLHVDMGIVHRVWLVESNKRTKLDWVSLNDLDDNYRYDGLSHDGGKPKRWTINAGKLELDPVPDGSYTIAMRGERKAGSLGNVPEDFRDIVLVAALKFIDPAYLPVFETELRIALRNSRPNTGRQMQWGHSDTVEAQKAERYDRNVV